VASPLLWEVRESVFGGFGILTKDEIAPGTVLFKIPLHLLVVEDTQHELVQVLDFMLFMLLDETVSSCQDVEEGEEEEMKWLFFEPYLITLPAIDERFRLPSFFDVGRSNLAETLVRSRIHDVWIQETFQGDWVKKKALVPLADLLNGVFEVGANARCATNTDDFSFTCETTRYIGQGEEILVKYGSKFATKSQVEDSFGKLSSNTL